MRTGMLHKPAPAKGGEGCHAIPRNAGQMDFLAKPSDLRDRNELTMVTKIILLLFSAILIYIGIYFIVPDVSKLKKENPRKTSFMEFREQEGEKGGNRFESDSNGFL